MLCCFHIYILGYTYAHTLRVPENEMLRKIIPKREEVASGWKELHNEIYNLQPLTN